MSSPKVTLHIYYDKSHIINQLCSFVYFIVHNLARNLPSQSLIYQGFQPVAFPGCNPYFLPYFCFNIPDSILPQFYHHSNPQFSHASIPCNSKAQVKFVQCLLGLLGLRTLRPRVLNRLRRPAHTYAHEPQNFSTSFSISYKANKKYFLTRIAIRYSFALDSNANHSFFLFPSYMCWPHRLPICCEARTNRPAMHPPVRLNGIYWSK